MLTTASPDQRRQARERLGRLREIEEHLSQGHPELVIDARGHITQSTSQIADTQAVIDEFPRLNPISTLRESRLADAAIHQRTGSALAAMDARLEGAFPVQHLMPDGSWAEVHGIPVAVQLPEFGILYLGNKRWYLEGGTVTYDFLIGDGETEERELEFKSKSFRLSQGWIGFGVNVARAIRPDGTPIGEGQNTRFNVVDAYLSTVNSQHDFAIQPLSTLDPNQSWRVTAGFMGIWFLRSPDYRHPQPFALAGAFDFSQTNVGFQPHLALHAE